MDSREFLRCWPSFSHADTGVFLTGCGCVFVKRGDCRAICAPWICWQRYDQRIADTHWTIERMVSHRMLLHIDVTRGLHECWAGRSAHSNVSG